MEAHHSAERSLRSQTKSSNSLGMVVRVHSTHTIWKVEEEWKKKCRIDFCPPRGSWLTGYCEKTPSWRLFFLSFKSNLVSPGAKINHAPPWQAHGDVHVSQPPWLVVAMWTVMGADRGWEEGVRRVGGVGVWRGVGAIWHDNRSSNGRLVRDSGR